MNDQHVCGIRIPFSFINEMKRFIYRITALSVCTAPSTLTKLYDTFITILKDRMIDGSFPNATGVHLEIAMGAKVDGGVGFYRNNLFCIYDLNVRNIDI